MNPSGRGSPSGKGFEPLLTVSGIRAFSLLPLARFQNDVSGGADGAPGQRFGRGRELGCEGFWPLHYLGLFVPQDRERGVCVCVWFLPSGLPPVVLLIPSELSRQTRRRLDFARASGSSSRLASPFPGFIACFFFFLFSSLGIVTFARSLHGCLGRFFQNSERECRVYLRDLCMRVGRSGSNKLPERTRHGARREKRCVRMHHHHNDRHSRKAPKGLLRRDLEQRARCVLHDTTTTFSPPAPRACFTPGSETG